MENRRANHPQISEGPTCAHAPMVANGMKVSICMRCLTVVAYGRDEQILDIADRAHKCNAGMAQKRATTSVLD